MADIEAERAWLRRHGEQQQADDETTQTTRHAQDRARRAQTCAYCFHEQHVLEIGSYSVWPAFVQHGETSIVVLYCQAETGCQCGVPPCAQCGSRIRAAFMEGTTTERCAGCGAEWQVSAIA